jgi:hypothetical protein
MGSGRRLANAKKKYGIESFKKEILSFHETPEEMLAEEARLVNEEFIGRDDVYNLTVGGKGSWFFVNLTYPKEKRLEVAHLAGKARVEWLRKQLKDPEFRLQYSKACSIGGNKRWAVGEIRERMLGGLASARLVASSSDSNEKRKCTFEAINHQQGEKNSQFGRFWITNGTENRSVKKSDLIPEGWRKGRVLK